MSAPTNKGDTASPSLLLGGESSLKFEATDRRRHRSVIVWRAQRMAFWVLYDHLGLCIAYNILTLVVVVVPWWMTVNIAEVHPAVVLPGMVVLLSFLVAGQAFLINGLLAGEAFDFRRICVGMGRFGPSVTVLVAVFIFLMASVGLGIWFYANGVAVDYPMVGAIAAQVCACTGVFVSMVGFYAVPALMVRGGGPLRALGVSIKLVLRHPVASAGFLVTAFVCVVFMMTPPGLALLSSWPLVTVACCAYELLARYHRDGEAQADGEDEYLNRGFREFLFPWKG